MNDKEENSESYDHEPTILGTEDQKIIEQKPPNDKIVHYKILKKMRIQKLNKIHELISKNYILCKTLKRTPEIKRKKIYPNNLIIYVTLISKELLQLL